MYPNALYWRLFKARTRSLSVAIHVCLPKGKKYKKFGGFDFCARLIRQGSIYSSEGEPHVKCSVAYTDTLVGILHICLALDLLCFTRERHLKEPVTSTATSADCP